MRRLINAPPGHAARRVAAALALILALPVLAGSASRQTGTVAGTITDQGTNAPIPSAQVMIVGTTRGALTNDQGKFTITGVTSGPAQSG